MQRPCDIWLWDGRIEYEGVVAKFTEPDFTAHLRDAREAEPRLGAGRRVPSTFFDLQRQFVGRRLLAFCRLSAEPQLQEAEITSIQRSSASGCDLFVAGRLRTLDASRLASLPPIPAGVPREVVGGSP